ncbi:MAG: hypothetical protein IJE49_11700 [Agathobacter sp.]|nr:hypothetical protein [Agathobacter sp.]
MKKFKRYLFIAVAVITMLLTGCGAELYELTAEEENLIIHSAAYFVAKHNIQQKDGVNGYPLPDSFDEEESESESETETETETESESESGGSGSEGPTETQKPSEDMITLAELIGHANDLKVTYEGSSVTNTYMEGTAYLVDAAQGKTFYVMKFKLTNTTDADVEVNNASKSPIVKLVSDAVTVKSEVTFLATDFSTYQGTLKAGESVETILLFEVSEAVAEKITAPKLQITVEKTTKTIKL